MAGIYGLATPTATRDPLTLNGAAKAWRSLWMIGASIGVLAVIALVVMPARHSAARTSRTHSFLSPDSLASVAGPGRIMVRPDTPLARSIRIFTVQPQSVDFPVLTVTGSIVARVRPGAESIECRWQFASAEVASTYADWLKTKVDMEFAQKQLDATRELTQAQVSRHERIVERLRPLAPSGDIPVKDYMEAEADLLQAELRGQKEVFEMESQFRSAQRRHHALERDLSQAGIETEALARGREGMVLVSANVPEAKINLVSRGQSSVVRFFGLPGVSFKAHVEDLGTVLSTERRTLRVLFDFEDTENRLRPGMFAEIGLGTDPREAMLIPTSAVIHLNREDYTFRQSGDARYYDVVKVEVCEAPGDMVEVVAGLSPGDRIAGNDAVLFKPLAIRSLAQ